MTEDVELACLPSHWYSKVAVSRHALHLDFLVCVATSKIQSSPLNNLLISSNGVATKVGVAFEPVRL
jgi:hypothetical protein